MHLYVHIILECHTETNVTTYYQYIMKAAMYLENLNLVCLLTVTWAPL